MISQYCDVPSRFQLSLLIHLSLQSKISHSLLSHCRIASRITYCTDWRITSRITHALLTVDAFSLFSILFFTFALSWYTSLYNLKFRIHSSATDALLHALLTHYLLLMPSVYFQFYLLFITHVLLNCWYTCLYNLKYLIHSTATDALHHALLTHYLLLIPYMYFYFFTHVLLNCWCCICMRCLLQCITHTLFSFLFFFIFVAFNYCWCIAASACVAYCNTHYSCLIFIFFIVLLNCWCIAASAGVAYCITHSTPALSRALIALSRALIALSSALIALSRALISLSIASIARCWALIQLSRALLELNGGY